ncbi:MAG: GAF domain-containing protein [Planctomycetes bacterium]|nr:GAF domain-containing protein [Planctomycetota bacterium]
MARLIVKRGKKILKEVVVNKQTFSIGRLPENDLELQDNMASRKHSELILRDNKYLVYDLGSANGLTVNKKKATVKTLEDGDEIQIGDTVMVFKQEDGMSVPSGAPPAPSKKDLPPELSSDIIKSVGDIPLDYRMDAKEMIKSGESLVAAAKPVAKSKEAESFFLLYQLGKAVTSATSLDEVLDIAMASIFDFFHADRGLIMLLDKDGEKLIPKVTKCRGKDTPDQINVSSTITNKVIKDKVSIITSDAKSDPRFEMGMSIAQFNIRSALCVPLWEKQEVFGVIYLDNLMKSYAFKSSDLDLLTAIANQIAIRIKQEELYEKLTNEALMRTNLERYHSPDVVERIIKGGGEIKMEVEEKEATVVFADIQDFTTISERMDPQNLASMLNDFFETASHIVFEFNGSVNKYIGDAVMAIFGAPTPLEDHAVKAVEAALKMVRELGKLQENIDESKRERYHVRVGINTGKLVAGNIGSVKRIEYTVLGDVVNVASRLNQYGKSNQVVIGEGTYAYAKDKFKFKDLGKVKLKGKKKELKVYQVFS